MSSRVLSLVLLAVAFVAACEITLDEPAPRVAPAYESEIRTLLDARCLRCHARGASDAGTTWSAASYLDVIGCGDVAAALAREDHAGLLTREERSAIDAWLAASSPATVAGVHALAFANPRAPGNHAAALRSTLYRPLIDPHDADACAVCHQGVATDQPGPRFAAPGAPACTTCHQAGVEACTTCHGDGTRAYPPRHACRLPETKPDRAHAAHVERGMSCASCHATGAHRDGKVDVACTGSACHARGGARPSPAWSDGPLGCGDCHRAPPEDHYAGACTSCHRVEAASHVNGKVDLGDGSGTCGACHGAGDEPRPTTGAHAKHGFACETCHDGSPALAGARHPRGGTAMVKLGGLAARGGRRPSYDATTKSCAGTYCHEGRGGRMPTPAWTSREPAGCGGCHGAPPPPPHTTDVRCESCHLVGGPTHVNGVLDFR